MSDSISVFEKRVSCSLWCTADELVRQLLGFFPSIPSISWLGHTEIINNYATSDFCVDSEDSNSCCWAGTSSIWPTEPSPQPWFTLALCYFIQSSLCLLINSVMHSENLVMLSVLSMASSFFSESVWKMPYRSYHFSPRERNIARPSF